MDSDDPTDQWADRQAINKTEPTQSIKRKALPNHSHSRRASALELMSIIPESEEADLSILSGSRNQDSLLHHQASTSRPASSSSSILRRITKSLSNASRLNSANNLPSSIPLTSFRSLRKPHGPGYENLSEVDDDAGVPVDLSLLSGLGFELTEPEPSQSMDSYEQDTSDQSPRLENTKPRFQSFVRRRQLGDGLVVGAKLKRDRSGRQEDGHQAKAEVLNRNATVRDAAQNFAEKRNVIVAVSEAVDLSFLEGPDVRSKTGNNNFDSFPNATRTTEDIPESYFFPSDPDVPSWRPKTMSTPYILFLTLVAFGIAACQEYLCQKSQQLQAESSGILAFDQVSDVSVGVFFVWKYLPTMITIIYAVLFSVMDFDIRRLEPFYQLSQPHGSPASESLNIDHLTMFQYFLPFKAFRLRQWTVFFSTIGNIIASTGSPALQNPSLNFEVNPACTTIGGNSNGNNAKIECPLVGDSFAKQYVVVVVPVWSRLLSASYIVVGITAVVLFFQLRRKSGLESDPKGIAGIASMATKSHILREFSGTDIATRHEIQERLAHRRFILYKSTIWQGQWSPETEHHQGSKNQLESPHPPMLRLAVGIPFIAAQIFCLVAVPIISLTEANVIPNDAPWLPILIATILKLVWSTFEADIRLMEPFYQLSRGDASPENSLTLDYQATVYGFMPFKAAFNRHWLLCIVGICSVALDVLSVTVSSFSIQADLFYDQVGHKNGPISSGDESRLSFWASVVLSIVILILVIFTTILVYLRRRHPFLPREPSTIASILAFIYASNMLEDFIGTEKFTNREMEAKLKKIGKKYALGWFRGRDGQIHCAIDQEPMTSRYVHGKPYADAVAGPVDIHGPYYP